jgi:cellulose synthase/poly-beta-1,6-N-acetylglucosamine synthase-like glycosyltransferase
MPPITAILHTLNDASRLGRALETLRPCDEILVVDHGSTDATLSIARQHGARITTADPQDPPEKHAAAASHDWVLCLLPSESLSEGLEASLFEWKLYALEDVQKVTACSTFVRLETDQGWVEQAPSTRLVPKDWKHWSGNLPAHDQRSMLLQGALLRFCQP